MFEVRLPAQVSASAPAGDTRAGRHRAGDEHCEDDRQRPNEENRRAPEPGDEKHQLDPQQRDPEVAESPKLQDESSL